LLDLVTDAEARAVMQRLREASRQRHLPAFRRCLAQRRASSSGRPADLDPGSTGA